ncbi:MAG TPA: enolase C-terminal domain-like protein [Bacteroidales bacterium]|nr:enolase C-terminal domain-like protein [Bacteroidales bacterium]
MHFSLNQIASIEVNTYKIPTDLPESDGTYVWDHTIMILVTVSGGGKSGIGYTYGNEVIAPYIQNKLASLIVGKDILDIEYLHNLMFRQIRNDGNCGIAYMAISAMDIALWDLKARILELPLASLLGKASESIAIYGSGGFTSYDNNQLTQQFEQWAKEGIQYMKMKIGREPKQDIDRIKTAKTAIGNNTLFVDANGAYTVKQALKMAEEFIKYDVQWYEEPVSSDNTDGLHFIRAHTPACINISAGEYGYTLSYFKKMLEAQAVDVLQADITRCGGVTGFLKAGHLCQAFGIPFSSHCAPALHANVATALPNFYIAEYFHDHVRIENEFFDGMPAPTNGRLFPNSDKYGLGLELKTHDVVKYRIK